VTCSVTLIMSLKWARKQPESMMNMQVSRLSEISQRQPCQES